MEETPRSEKEDWNHEDSFGQAAELKAEIEIIYTWMSEEEKEQLPNKFSEKVLDSIQAVAEVQEMLDEAFEITIESELEDVEPFYDL
jgi:hypothetical protein